MSEQLYLTVANFTTMIESVSCDELYADLSQYDDVDEILTKIRNSFHQKTGITGKGCYF